MDPITVIAGALVAGAAASLKDVVEQSIKDGYDGLKTLIRERYQRVPVEMLETDPNNQGRQEILQQDLASAGAGKDQELLQQAKALLEAVKEHAPEVARDIRVNLRGGKIKQDVDIDTLIAEAGSIDVDAGGVEVEGSFKLKNVRTGGGTGNN